VGRVFETPALGHANFFDDGLGLAIRYLLALALFLFSKVTEAFFYTS